MRNLPPLPPDILQLRAIGDLNGSKWSIAHYLHCPGSVAYTVTEFGEIVTAWATFAMPFLLAVMPSSAGFDTCRLARVGSVPFVFTSDLAANSGGGSSAQSLNTALCFTWHTEAKGLVSRSHTRLPLQASIVDNDKRQIDPAFRGFANLNAADYLQQMNAITVAGFSTPQFVVVSRSRGDAPLPAAGFSPVVTGDASPRVATLRSRLLQSG